MLPAHLLPLPLSDTAAAALSVVCIIREVTDELRDLDAYAKFKFKKHKRLFHPRHIKAHEQLAKKKRDEQEKEQEQGHEDDDDDDDDSDRFACSVQSVERSRAALLSVYAKPKLCMPCAHTCLHARTHAHTHTHRHTDTHIHTHTHTERDTHTETQRHTHTHTHTHIHTHKHPLFCLRLHHSGLPLAGLVFAIAGRLPQSQAAVKKRIAVRRVSFLPRRICVLSGKRI